MIAIYKVMMIKIKDKIKIEKKKLEISQKKLKNLNNLLDWKRDFKKPAED